MNKVEDITNVKHILEEKFKEIYGEKITEIEIRSAIKYATFGYWDITAKIKVNGFQSEYSIKIDVDTGNITSLTKK